MTVINGVTTTYTTNNMNQYTSVGGVACKYDANGNLLYDGTNTYTYNSLNELTSVTGPSGTTTYTYNALGQRVSSTTNGQTTQYLVDPTGLGNIVGAYSGSGTITASSLIADYTYGHGLTSQVTTSGTYYYDFDALGSTVGMSNATGSYVNSYSYLPFGGILAETQGVANPFQFVGQYGAMTTIAGLVTMGFRTYTPGTGRFTSEDPLGLGGGQMNLYCYVGNNPVLGVDPYGLAFRLSWQNITYILKWTDKSLDTLKTSNDYGKFLGQLSSGLCQEATATVGSMVVGFFYGLAGGIAGAGLGGIAGFGIGKMPGAVVGAAAGGFAGGYVFGEMGGQIGEGIGGDIGKHICPNSPTPTSTPPIPSWPAPPAPYAPPKNIGTIDWVLSSDPNGIVGPASYGSANFVNASSVLPYTIDFENSSTATASAGEIQITQQLSPNLDWSTFQLGAIELGSLDIAIPGGLTSINETFDERSTLGTYIQVVAGLNANTGVVTWTLTALDPTTMQIPEDPLLGLLPPDLLPPEGDGSVSYTIRPKSSDTTGTIVNAQASIIFDVNAPIATQQISDTLDAGPVTSYINPLPAIETSASFPVSWTGQDDPGGSGIASYTVYVSDDSGPFLPWSTDTATTDTSATYTGQYGHSYAFTVTAVDNVGHQQLVASTAVSTTVDTVIPAVSTMLVENGLTERSYVDQLTFQFNKPVTSTAAVPMTLTEYNTLGNLIGSVTLTTGQFQWSTVPGTGASVLTWSLEGSAGGTSSLPDGYYQLTLPSAQIADQYGEPLSGGTNYVANFSVLQGDVNGDGVVDSNDMAIVNAALGGRPGSSNWNPNADLNRESRVVTSDRIIVYDNMGHSITPPVGKQVLAAAVSLPAWSFDGSTQLTTTNSLPAGSPVAGITFNADAGAYVLNGNAVELSGNITNQSPNTQTINLPLTLLGNQTINTAAGNVVITGGIGQSSGSLGITKTGSGTLVLSGANTYLGGTTVLAGILQVTSSDSLPDGSSLTVGAGATLIFGGSQSAMAAQSSGLVATTAQSSTPAAIVASPAVVVSPASGGAALPASLPGNNPAATVASVNSVAKVSAASVGTASTPAKSQPAMPIAPLSVVRSNSFAVSHHSVLGPSPLRASGASVPAAAAVLPPKSTKDQGQLQATAICPQAHDAVLLSLNTPAAAAGAGAAALWDWDSNWPSGPSDTKHGAVDAVMAMLARMQKQ